MLNCDVLTLLIKFIKYVLQMLPSSKSNSVSWRSRWYGSKRKDLVNDDQIFQKCIIFTLLFL
jgi:hypothetical protein